MATANTILSCLERGAASMNILLHVGNKRNMVAEWTKAFSDLSNDDFVAAYNTTITTCTRLPTIADVIRAHNELNTKARSDGDVPDLGNWKQQDSDKGKLWVEVVKAGFAGDYERKIELVNQLRAHGVDERLLRPIENASFAVLNGDRQGAMNATASADLPYPLGQRAIDAAQSMFSYEGGK